MISILPPADATDDEVAAALAAIHYVLASETVADDQPTQRATWRESGRLLMQDITPARLPAPAWSNIERLRRLRGRTYRT